MVVVDELTRVFEGPPEVTALQPSSFRIDRGDFAAITGRSGSGKSTLLSLLGLLDQPTAGRYWLDGLDVQELSDRQRSAVRAHRLGFVFQAFHLIPYRTVLDNVELGLTYQGVARAERRIRAAEVIDQVGLGSRRDALCSHLSGGEKQRVAIARALIRRPSLVLCDEPTGNLDSATGQQILDLIRRVHSESELTVVIITHDSEVAALATRHFIINDGYVGELVADRREVGDDRSRGSSTTKASRVLRSRLRFLDNVTESMAAILRRPTRTLLTALGTVLGVGAFVATTGLADTARAQLSSTFDALKATEVRIQDAEPDGSNPFPVDVDERLARLNGVRNAGLIHQVIDPGWISPRPSARRELGEGRIVPVVGASPGALLAARPVLAAGRLYDRFHLDRAERVAVLGREAAEQLGVTRLDNQPAVFIDGVGYTVIGIIADVRRYPDLLASIIVPTTTAHAELASGMTGYEVVIETEQGAASLVGRQAPLSLYPQDPGRLRALVPPDPRTLRNRVESDVTNFAYALSSLALLVGTIVIANATLMSTIERRPEIGLRRALGATRVHIIRQIVAEACVIGTAAAAVGTAVGVILIGSVARVRGWSATIDPVVTLMAPAIGLVTGAVAGVVPALKAARTPPTATLVS